MNKTWFYSFLSLALLASLLLGACGASPEPAATTAPTEPTEIAEPAEPAASPAAVEPTEATEAEAPAETGEGATLRVGTTYIWDTANPAIGWYNYTLRYLLHDTLVEEAGISNFVPGLAESWDVSDDGQVWTFQIREGVTFHDGTPCTAEDVAWSLNWTIENEIETFSFYLANFQEVLALDPTTLQVTLSEPVGNMEYLLMYVWILPRSVWEGMGPDEILEFEDLAAATGTGPYKLVDWVEGEYLILDANPDYWRGAPNIDRVIWQEYATEDAIVQALLAGEVDVVYELPRTAIATLEGRDDVGLAVMPSTVIDELIINSHEEGSQPESLDDPRVRLAIAHAIDKQQIVNIAFLGYAEPATGVIPRSMGDWFNTDLEDVPYDPAEGNRILDEAGFLDGDDDGIREDLQGNPLEYRLYAEDDATETRILEIISDGLAQVGISAPPTPMDEDSLIALYPAFDFDLILWGWGLDPDPDFAMLIFTCDQREEGGWNDSGYCNDEFDQLYAAQAVTVDREERRQLIWEMQRKLFDDRPYIVLDYEQWVQAYRSDRFTGFGLEAGDILWKSSFLPATPVQ